ncbi:DUF5134 domain-containing protein [Actinospica durhamensis]|uniref:DUF5134 domain-containing protein n=1 Tax=Actinospica durhamensis TaxID=1508375 RepID=A0A941ITG1_9ACTN|nr:DUF5134 domain-containing protein [Actinospica durhamensis]MBR7839729.1 DUF5134 domain-containing protein [Actinospica durhamensis]
MYWFFTLILLALAARAVARLVLARASGGLPDAVRHAELAHAAMGLGMAILLVPGLPRPPTALSVSFFAALAAFAVFAWVRGVTARWRGRTTNCGCAPKNSAHLLDPHHAIVGAAMVVMLLYPAAGGMDMGGASAGGMAGMAGMTGAATGSPAVTVLVFLGYVWLSALVLGYGMTRLLPAAAEVDGGALALLGSPATVYGCELAMTVLTGLMLLS